jgi:hypothetical protein
MLLLSSSSPSSFISYLYLQTTKTAVYFPEGDRPLNTPSSIFLDRGPSYNVPAFGSLPHLLSSLSDFSIVCLPS